MPVKVIDASALAAVLLGEPQAEEVVDRLKGYTLAGPALLPFEVAAVCLKKIRRHPTQRAALLASLGALQRMAIAESRVEMQEALLLAERRRLTVYDAVYLWLAHRLGAELITLDKKLAAAAR